LIGSELQITEDRREGKVKERDASADSCDSAHQLPQCTDDLKSILTIINTLEVW